MGNAVLNEVMEANLTDPKPSPDSDMWDGEREKEGKRDPGARLEMKSKLVLD